MGVVGTIAPLGGVVGPGIGGVLLVGFGWQSIFLVNLPICAMTAVLGGLSLKGVRLRADGQPSRDTLGQMAKLLRQPRFLSGLLAFLLSIAMSVGLYFLLPFDLGGIQGLAPGSAGILLLLVPLGMMSMGMVGGYLTDKFSPKLLVLSGAAMILLGIMSLSLVLAHKTTELDLVWRLLLVGSGIGLFSSPNSTVLIGFAGRNSMASASALVNLGARVGSVLGPLLIGSAWAFSPELSGRVEFGCLILSVLAFLTLVAVALPTRPTNQLSP